MEELLKKLENEEKNIDKETGFLLSNLAKGKVLEIGTNHGYSTYWLSKNTEIVISFEIKKERAEQAKNNLKILKVKNVKVINKDFLESNLNEKFDFVFIDAEKKQYLNYFKKILPLTKENSLIVCDNVISHKEKMQDFLDYISKLDLQKIILNLRKGILIILPIPKKNI